MGVHERCELRVGVHKFLVVNNYEKQGGLGTRLTQTGRQTDRQRDRETDLSQYPTALHLLHLISFLLFLVTRPQVEHLVGKMGSWTR